jgi:adenosylmethionine-8-amino-7-oxononanoate aminotransferase
VALASLQLFDQEDILSRNRDKAIAMRSAVASLEDHPHVGEIRQQGMILAIEMAQNGKTRTPYPAEERRGLRVYQAALKEGVILRPLGNVIYFMPPYVINPEEIQRMASAAIIGIHSATQED